jgi:hypothetical protein
MTAVNFGLRLVAHKECNRIAFASGLGLKRRCFGYLR